MILPNHTLREWRFVFWILFVVYIVTTIVLSLYVSGKIQPWNDPVQHYADKTEKRAKKAQTNAAKSKK